MRPDVPAVPVRGAAALPPGADERRQLTVMFTDLAGSTELASALDPEDWREVLDGYQHVVARAVAAHHGVVTQFQGDGVVAYFGYPEAVETAGRDALAAGLDVVAAVAEFGAGLPAELGVGPLAARAGIHTGTVVVAAAHAGGVERPADIFGEVPNLAARLQAAASAGDVVVSETSAALASGYFELEALGATPLKGLPRPVPVFKVLRPSAARSRLEALPLTGFVARDGPWRWLEDQWAAAVAGAGRVVALVGEPGIGKSRLLQEFAVAVARRGHPVPTLYCSRHEALSPLHPFGPPMGAVPATPEVAAAWLDAQAAGGPILVVVEDAHWSDPSTLEVVHRVGRGRRSTLVVLTARPEIADVAGVGLAGRLELRRLDAAAARDLVGRVPGGRDLPEDVQAALVQRADGVPLFVEELTRSVVERSLPDGRAAIPATLSEVLAARLDRLGSARRVAQLAAVVGRAFDPAVLAAVAGVDVAALDADLQRLVDHAIVEAPVGPGAPMWFRHALIHEAAYGSLLRAERRRAHSVAAAAMVASGGSERRPELVAHHFAAAGRPAEAVEHWRRAAQAARRRARFREAAGHEREVLSLVALLPEAARDEVELAARSRLALCLTAVDQAAPDALPEARRAQELARRLDDRVALLRSHLVLLPWLQANADYGAIDRSLPEARRLAAEVGDAWSEVALAEMEGMVRVWQGRLTEGLDLLARSPGPAGIPLDRSLATLAPMSSPAVLVRASVRVGAALGHWLAGSFADAARLAGDAIDFAAQRAVPQAQAVTAATAALIAQLDGDRDEVLRLTRPDRQPPDDVSTRQWSQWTANLRRWAAGPGPTPAGTVREPATPVPELPGPLLRPYFLALRADDPGADPAVALGQLDEAQEGARRTGEQFCQAEILRIRAGVLARSGRHRAAADARRDGLAVARAQAARGLELRILTDIVAASGSRAGPRAELVRCVDALGGGAATHGLAVAAAVLAGS